MYNWASQNNINFNQNYRNGYYPPIYNSESALYQYGPGIFPSALSTTPRSASKTEPTTKRPTVNSEIPKPEKLITNSKSNIIILNASQQHNNSFDIQQIYPAIKNSKLQQVVASAIGSTTSLDGNENTLNGTETVFQGATLIIEPKSKAISGNGGTSISAPVSRAILRRSSGTTIIFRPESVAIAGVGGTAHASADLILDYME